MSGAVDFVEDPFIHIRSIRLEVGGPAIVVMAQRLSGFNGELYVGKPGASATQEWQLVADPRPIGTYFTSVAFAMAPQSGDPENTKPTFIAVTGFDQAVAPAKVYCSNDGEHWDPVFDAYGATGESGVGFWGLVWHPDDKKFYGVTEDTDFNPVSDTIIIRFAIWESQDGRGWGLHQEWQVTLVFPFDADDTAAFNATQSAAEAAFRALMVKPANKGGIPDGYQGYDASKKILIKPKHNVWSMDGYGIYAGEGSIEIEIDGAPATGGAGLPIDVFAVSFANGVWNAVIYKTGEDDVPQDIYISTDDGKNWTQTFSPAPAFRPAGIIAGSSSPTVTP